MTASDDLTRLAEISRTLLDYSTELADIRARLVADFEQWAEGEALNPVEPAVRAWLRYDGYDHDEYPLEPCEQVADCWYTLDELAGICDEWGCQLAAAASLTEYRLDPQAVDSCTMLNAEEQRALKQQRKPLG